MLVSKKEYNKLKKQKDELIASLEAEIDTVLDPIK